MSSRPILPLAMLALAAVMLVGGVSWFIIHRGATVAVVTGDWGTEKPGSQCSGSAISVADGAQTWAGFGPESWARLGTESTIDGRLEVHDDDTATFVATDGAMSSLLHRLPHGQVAIACAI